jgi:hypothetical protein
LESGARDVVGVDVALHRFMNALKALGREPDLSGLMF